MSKTITVEYFAILREERKLSSEVFLTESETLAELYNELKQRYKFSLPQERLRVAVDDEFQRWETAIKDSDRVVFIPPVAGG